MARSHTAHLETVDKTPRCFCTQSHLATTCCVSLGKSLDLSPAGVAGELFGWGKTPCTLKCSACGGSVRVKENTLKKQVFSLSFLDFECFLCYSVGSSYISILDFSVRGCDLGLLSSLINMHSFGDLILL